MRTFAIIVLLAALAGATDYYVDPLGSDSGSGNSQSAAWKTIAKVNSEDFQPGDRVLFKAGGTWHGQVTVPSSGTAAAPITFSSYGSGAKPVLEGGEEITSWTRHTGSIYTADVGFNVQQVFLDGKFMDLAHHPNSGYLKADEGGKFWFIDNDLGFSDSELLNAGVIVRTTRWTMEYSNIIDIDSKNISLEGLLSSMSMIDPGDTYLLTDRFWMLDSPGEWIYSNGKLYVWMPDGSSPANHEIIASKYDNGIYNSDKDNIIIDGFEIRHYAHSGVWIRKGDNVIVRNCDISLIGSHRYKDVWNHDGNGVYVWESESGPFTNNKALVTGNTITDILRRGVRTGRYRNVEVSYNDIQDIGMTGLPSDGIGVAAGKHIHHNKVQHTAYIGISTGQATSNYQDTLVEYNYVNDSCNTLDDGGSIYNGGISRYKRKIIHNLMENSGDDWNVLTFAIYLDGSGNNIDVFDNTVVNAKYGIHVHTGDDNHIDGNTVFDCQWPLTVQRDSLTTGTTLNNLWENNIAVSLVDNYVVHNVNYKDSLYETGRYNHNIYSSMNPDGIIREHYRNPDYPPGPYSIDNNYTFEEWQDIRGQDLDSTYVQNDGDAIIIVNREFGTQTFSSPDGRAYTELDGTPVSFPITLEGLTSIVLLPGDGCAVECSSSGDCGNDLCRSYSCSNPGTCESECSYTEITACIDDDGCCPSGCDDTDCGLIMYYPMEIAGSVVPDMAGNHEATIFGTPTVVQGKVGDALEFDGSDYLDTGYTADIPEWTVSVWAKSDDAPDSDLNSGPVMKHGNFLISWDHQSDSYREAAAIKVGSSWYPASYGPLSAGSWHHLAASYDGETLRAYRDGEMITENTAPSGPPVGDDISLKIARHALNNQFFHGIVDEVRVYNQVLTEDEIMQLAGCSPGDKDCSGCVDMQELLDHIELWHQSQISISEIVDAIGIWLGCA